MLWRGSHLLLLAAAISGHVSCRHWVEQSRGVCNIQIKLETLDCSNGKVYEALLQFCCKNNKHCSYHIFGVLLHFLSSFLSVFLKQRIGSLGSRSSTKIYQCQVWYKFNWWITNRSRICIADRYSVRLTNLVHAFFFLIILATDTYCCFLMFEDYIYHTLAAKASGELCLKYIFSFGAFARKPLLQWLASYTYQLLVNCSLILTMHNVLLSWFSYGN